MKIAMISLLPDPLATDGSGQSIHATELARQLGREGHHITFYVRRECPKARDKIRFASGVTVEHVTVGPTQPVPSDHVLAYVSEFGRHLAGRWRDDRPDVVHAFYWTSGLAALAAAQDLSIPVVQTYHVLGLQEVATQVADDPAYRRRIRLEKAIGMTADAVIATCADEVGRLLRLSVPRHRIEVIPTGVDVERFAPQGPASPRGKSRRLLVLSDLYAWADVAIAIRVLARIPGAELLVAGGPARDELETDEQVHRLRVIAKEAGVAHRVTFLGRLAHKNVPRLLRSADLVLTLPSHTSSGTVTLEAMACGVPVVTTDTGGNADSVIDGVTGIHVPAERPAEVARRVRALLGDPTHINALGIAAADRARARFAWPRVAGETATVYQKVIARRNPREVAPRHRG